MPKPLPLPLASLGALASGALIGLAFAPFKIWPLAIIGVAVLSWLLLGRTRRVGFGLGYLAGLGLNAVTISWIGVLGWFVPVALVAFMALWVALLGWLTVALQRLAAWPAWVACAWVLAELGASNVPLGGFGWNRLAFSTADQPLSGFLPWIGVAGVSWLVALCGGLLVVIAQRPKRALVPAVLVAVLFASGGVLKLAPIDQPSERVTIGMVQGNVDGVGHGNAGYARSVTNNHLSETIALMAKVRTGQHAQPDFVLWPENSTDIDPTNDPTTRDLVQYSALIAGLPIFVGAVMDGPGKDERQTTGLWWDPVTGVGPRYNKRNLVPFGEWIPFRDVLLPKMPILKRIGRQGIPGTVPGVIEVPVSNHPQLRIGDVICFELAYDETVYDTMRNGAQVLVVQSNNATYTATGQPHQQFEITRIRAMETRREIVVATTNSFSGLIEPDGRVVAKTTEGKAASASFTVPLRTNVTLGVRLQPWAPIGVSIVALIGVALSLVRRRSATSE